MIGRLGMTGSSLSRGDKEIAKASLSPEEIKARIAASQARKRTPQQQATHQATATAANKVASVRIAPKKVPLKLLMPSTRQYGNWALDAAMVTGGATYLHHRKIAKADNTRRNAGAGAVVGLGATDGALNVGGWVHRENIKHHEAKVNAGIIPNTFTRSQRKDILAAHRAKHGVKGDIHDAGNAYYRDFPKNMPAWRAKRLVGFKNHPGAVAGMLTAGTVAGAAAGARRKNVAKASTTMSDHEAKTLAGKYDTRGPLPKGMDRESKMKAYEARYIASGGKKAEKWHRRAAGAEVARNVGLAGATLSAGAVLASRGKTGARLAAKVPHLKPHHIEAAGLGSAVGGGSAELYGEYARHRKASYANSPGGVAASALTRMRNYTPGAKP